MNKLTIPPPANWYEVNTIACAPDNTIVYASRNNIIVIHPKPQDEPADIEVSNQSYGERVTGVSLNPNWGNPDKFVVAVGDQKVSLFDIATNKIKSTHSGHTTRPDKLIGACFAGNDRIISVAEDGFIIIWRWSNNQLNSLSDLLGPKIKVSCVSSCLHASWLTAFGLKRGEIIITDLRKTGRVLYRLRGHDNVIISLSWCPTPYNIFPKRNLNKRKNSDKQLRLEETDHVKSESLEPKIVNDEPLIEIESEKSFEGQIEIVKSLEEKSLVETGYEGLKDLKFGKIAEKIDGTSEKGSANVSGEISTEVNTIEQIVELEKAGCNKNVVGVLDGVTKEMELLGLQESLEHEESNESLGHSESKEENVHIDEETHFDGEPEISNKEYLLASTCRGGRSIIIWRASTNGIKEVELNVLKQSKSRGNQRSRATPDQSWITLCWITPTGLLSSSANGELLLWNLDSSSSPIGEFKSKVIHSDHHGCIFGIAAPIKLESYVSQENWRNRIQLNAWTIGRDRLILNTSIGADRQPLAAYPTLSGTIFCIASSFTYPNRIAIGAAEGVCRVWDLSHPHQQYIVMTHIVHKKHQKITCLAFHPINESILAFATADGLIGLIDPCNRSKPQTMLIHYENSQVHRLEWGPHDGDLKVYGLYAVINGKLICYNVNKLLDAPIALDITDYITQMSWKPDYSVCAVGTKEGHVLLYSHQFQLLTTLYQQNKSIRWMTWHPEATNEDEDTSPYSNWLAVATNDVTIYDCKLNNDPESQDHAQKIVAIFTEQKKTILCLSWSTFEGGKLASTGDDGAVFVWDVKAKTLIHCCIKENITTILWSPIDADYVITGTKNSMLHIWKLSEHPPDILPVKKPKPSKTKDIIEVKTTNADVDQNVEEIEKPKKRSQKFVLAGLVEFLNRNDSNASMSNCEKLFMLHYGENREVETSEISEKHESIDPLKIFGNNEDVESVLKSEKIFNTKRKSNSSSAHISLWQGDIGTAIRDAMNTKTLTPWLISMAPSVSHKLYLEACESYARQLSELHNSNPYEIVSYYLMCHLLNEAIEVLCLNHYYSEALVLAKCRLGCADPIINNILEQWASYSMGVGNFESAAQCYIVLNQLEMAVKALFRRTDCSALSLCATMAEVCDNKSLLEAVLYRLNNSGASEAVVDKNVETPLLTRAELELNRQKLMGDSIIEPNKNSDEIKPVLQVDNEKEEGILKK